MADIRLYYNPTFQQELGPIDTRIEGGDLAKGRELETAVLLSLFLDRRSLDDDPIPDGTGNRRGWWGDSYPSVAGDQYGSRLWTLARAKQTPETLAAFQELATEALTWLVEDGVAERVVVEAEFPRPNWLAFTVQITRPGQVTPENFTHQLKWDELDVRPAREILYETPPETFALQLETGFFLLQENGARLLLE